MLVSKMTIAPIMQNTRMTPGSLAAQFLRFMSWWNSASLRAMRDLSKAAILSDVMFFGLKNLLGKISNQLSSRRSLSSSCVEVKELVSTWMTTLRCDRDKSLRAIHRGSGKTVQRNGKDFHATALYLNTRIFFWSALRHLL